MRYEHFPAPSFTHLRRLTDAGGLYEHALGTTPRREHGYCVDDVARALVVVCREDGPAQDDLREQYLSFVLAAQDADGRFRNRRGTDLRFLDAPSVDDCWGRALWALGTASADPRALAAFERGARWRSPSPRATAFAALGAAEVLSRRPGHGIALDLLAATPAAVGRPGGPEWPWPEPRLAYANALLPEALLAAGAALDAPALVADGLRLLDWLLDVQIRDGHLSLVPAAGRGPFESGPAFDQQPLEAAALADACARAHELTGQDRWLTGISLATAWFLGDNDAGTPLHDPESGGGCDGLERDGRNENQGAESTLALVSTLQQAAARLPARALRAAG
ncbi:glycosyltransferase [Pseudonocardia sp. MH-G8]|uniref:glycosyltransferase n=1 Tax=Pseudonocardia sp. MH-G8 TaxID=1854588 RepID=UPI000BA0FA03|nr:glycosyltransferase [Pseudonocardia sp. MH-G8]OZM82942.1 glycosyltransferase [Pseudonocardia sp. MH-G8]